MSNTHYDFIRKHIGLQGIEVLSANINNGIFQVFAASSHSFAVCPRCNNSSRKKQDVNAKPVIDRFHLAYNFHKCVDATIKHIQNPIRKYGKAVAFIEYFKDLARDYDIPELKVFCKTLDNWRPYILNYYDYRILSGLTEGNNHKVKNIKCRAYRYRNNHNFNLRMKFEFECA